MTTKGYQYENNSNVINFQYFKYQFRKCRRKKQKKWIHPPEKISKLKKYNRLEKTVRAPLVGALG